MSKEEFVKLITEYGWKKDTTIVDYMYRKSGYTIFTPPGKDFFWYKSGAGNENYIYQMQCKIQYSDIAIKEKESLYIHSGPPFKLIGTKECTLYI